MVFFKYLTRFILLVVVAVGVIGWFFYDAYRPVTVESDPLVVNDITGMNPVTVAENIRPTTIEEISEAIRATTGPISIGGARFSMGGQIAYPNSLHLDMRDFNKVVALDPEKKLITVQSGITWAEIQKVVDPHDLSVKIMQDYNNFTVGGSLSVNAHGRFLQGGPIINSVRSMKMVLADGQLYEADRQVNSPLFYAAIGGYGAIGVIVEVTLELADNLPLERTTHQMRFDEYLAYFNREIRYNPYLVLHNAFLYPPSFEILRDISWSLTDKPLTNDQRLRNFNRSHWWKPAAIDLIARSNLLKRLRENLLDPVRLEKPSVVMRNYETSYDLHEFGFASRRGSTLALREYFVPVDNFEMFVLKLRDVFIRHDVNVLNVSVRYSPTDRESLLSWAKQDVFSFVVSYQQDTDRNAIEEVDSWSSKLNEAAVEVGGSYYMPFQIQDSPDLFRQAYPNSGYFFEVKRWADPQNRFNNLLWLAYDPQNETAKAELSNIKPMATSQNNG